jgi:hypothetical protein
MKCLDIELQASEHKFYLFWWDLYFLTFLYSRSLSRASEHTNSHTHTLTYMCDNPTISCYIDTAVFWRVSSTMSGDKES